MLRLERWSDGDLDLLRQKNAPEMREHLGGPETEEAVLKRHRRYLEDGDPQVGLMFAIVLDTGERAGTIGYWERPWRDELVYETGWGVLPAYQGRGLASAAAQAVIEVAREQRRLRYLHAFPSVDHPASNAVCKKAGFTLLGETDFEYPPGTLMRSNDWRLELHPTFGARKAT
ncbi:GNAT family N-acetyltransferase [Actinomadura barringtoniae]|uniref:GNAT family N-acetyltransferase n=1 Tax=Actinomadura barringtoniae TaxID=1427535 RepID=UPI001FB64BE7|nr:GNAT family N-acetyltransferase [Actinomadura barringtoniae]